MSFRDIFNNIGKFAGSQSGQGFMNLAGLGLGLYGMNKQNKALDFQNDIAMKNYKYNKDLNDREIAKENMSQANFVNGFNNSSFANTFKKTQPKSIEEYYGNKNFKG